MASQVFDRLALQAYDRYSALHRVSAALVDSSWSTPNAMAHFQLARKLLASQDTFLLFISRYAEVDREKMAFQRKLEGRTTPTDALRALITHIKQQATPW